MTTAYLAAEGVERQLDEELQRSGAEVRARHERLLICEGSVPSAWAAKGAIPMPAVASEEVRNIRVLSDICTIPSPSGA